MTLDNASDECLNREHLPVNPEQWFPTILMLRSFNKVHHFLLTPAIALFGLLPHNSNFAAVRNRHVNIFGVRGLTKGVVIHRLRTTALDSEKLLV